MIRKSVTITVTRPGGAHASVGEIYNIETFDGESHIVRRYRNADATAHAYD